MYLWQIRHFPNNRQGLRARQGWTGVGIALMLALTGLAGRATPAVSADPVRTVAQATAPPASPPRAQAGAAGAALPVAKLSPASQTLAAAQQALSERRSIRADVVEHVHLGEPPLKLTGGYVSAGVKLRVQYRTALPGKVEGSLLEVCDGERLWSVMELPGSRRVTRRDVRQILAAVESNRIRPERAAAVDLALGGLPALLRSLQRTMTFEARKDDTFDDQPVIIIQGRWQTKFLEQVGVRSTTLPPQFPDLARLYLSRDSLFPVRLVYLKHTGEAKSLKALVDVQFRNVILDGPVDDHEFDFAPPDGVEPEDVTRQYLDQLFPPDPPQP